MKEKLSTEFLYQIIALLTIIVLVHGAYVGIIRPTAEAELQEQASLMASGVQVAPNRSLSVIIRDFEQEACFILMLWALAIMAYKGRQAFHERAMVNKPLLRIPEGTSVLPIDAREYSRGLENLPEAKQEFLLVRTFLTALQRFNTTGNIQAVSDTVKEQCDIEAERLDSELSMVRYIAWAIPSIGFIGTVRGIGEALGQAYKAVEGDISGVTASLGVAFNSTFVALILSIIIMFCLHQLQLSHERLVLDCQRCADKQLLRHLASE